MAIDFVKGQQAADLNIVSARILFNGYQDSNFHAAAIDFATKIGGGTLTDRLVLEEAGNVVPGGDNLYSLGKKGFDDPRYGRRTVPSRPRTFA